MAGHGFPSEGDRIGEVVTRVQLPLENLEFALDSYIQDNGSFLDKRTRAMLISVRDSVHRVALSARALGSEQDAAGGEEGSGARARPRKMLQTGT